MSILRIIILEDKIYFVKCYYINGERITMQKSMDIRKISMIGLMAALVFVGTYIRITIPLGFTSTMLHFGNVFGILGGLLFGPLGGGLAAGIGSAIFDLSSEYAAEAPITFINKFAMGFAAGLVANKFKAIQPNLNVMLTAISAASGSLTYIALYMLKNYVEMAFILAMPSEAIIPVLVPKLIVSFSNGITAVVAGTILYTALKPALVRARILR